MTDQTGLRVRLLLLEGARDAYGVPSPDDPAGRERYDWEAWGPPSNHDLAACDFGPEDAPLLRALLTTEHSSLRDSLINQALGRIGD